MARQHGYFVLIPAFIPVDKNSLQNQIKAGQVLNEAAQKRDLGAITSLEGIRYHALRDRAGNLKDMHVRWGSREVEAEPVGGETAETVETPDLDAASEETEAETTDETAADEATTTGRRRSRAAA